MSSIPIKLLFKKKQNKTEKSQVRPGWQEPAPALLLRPLLPASVQLVVGLLSVGVVLEPGQSS